MNKFAFVAIIGRPSAGKSTLLNKMCNEKVAIVSKVPQTTRNAIRGIVNYKTESMRGQLVFIDTPGRHVSEKKFNKKMLEVSDRALEECDLVLYVIDASRAPGHEEEEIANLVIPLLDKTIIAVNKIDLQNTSIEKIKEFLHNLRVSFGGIIPVSARTGDGVEELLKALLEIAPEGEPQYGEDYYTDQEVGFRISEIIREQAIRRLRQELPHTLYVDIADMELKEKESETVRGSLWVRAFIIVERESQKGMVVGKGGEMIKAIRLAALKELKNIFDWKIELDLRVKTGKDWRGKDHILNKIINKK